ncbi:MAG: hypothetical protein QG632_503 [Candidatus Dependentiae bacterium]|nr:hypothetical protein [Candidatus Dependentiae bacterium]
MKYFVNLFFSAAIVSFFPLQGEHSAQVMSEVYNLLNVLDASRARGEFASDKEGGFVKVLSASQSVYRCKSLTGKLLGLYDKPTNTAYILLGEGNIKKLMTGEAVARAHEIAPFHLYSVVLGTDAHQSQRMSFSALIDFIAQHPGLQLIPLLANYRDLTEDEEGLAGASIVVQILVPLYASIEYVARDGESSGIFHSPLGQIGLLLSSPVLALLSYLSLRSKSAPYQDPKVVFAMMQAMLAGEDLSMEKSEKITRSRRAAVAAFVAGLVSSMVIVHKLRSRKGESEKYHPDPVLPVQPRRNPLLRVLPPTREIYPVVEHPSRTPPCAPARPRCSSASSGFNTVEC